MTLQSLIRALKNLGAVLESIGATYKNIVKISVLLADIKDYARVNEVYLKSTGGGLVKLTSNNLRHQVFFPVRHDTFKRSTHASCIKFFPLCVRASDAHARKFDYLPKNAKIEIESIAVLGEIEDIQ